MKDLGTLGGDNSIAGGINDRGQVVGYTEINADIGHAFIWSKAEGMKSLGTLGGNESNALDINNRGQVVGSSTILPGDNFSVAFLWTPQEGMRLLGHQGLDTCWGSHINNKGQVMGNSINFNPVKMKAFFWAAPGPLKDLGTLGGENTAAASLNNKGQVVGSSHDGVEERAILWTQDQGLVDLNTLLVNPPAGDVLKFANQINDRGWIVGTTKNERAFLLTPK